MIFQISAKNDDFFKFLQKLMIFQTLAKIDDFSICSEILAKINDFFVKIDDFHFFCQNWWFFILLQKLMMFQNLAKIDDFQVADILKAATYIHYFLLLSFFLNFFDKKMLKFWKKIMFFQISAIFLVLIVYFKTHWLKIITIKPIVDDLVLQNTSVCFQDIVCTT